MSPISLLTFTDINKRYVSIIAVTLTIIVSMPIIAVFSLGEKTLSFLLGPEGTISTVAISTTTIGLYEGQEVVGDKYAWGNCTYWVYALRLEAGDPIPTTWGNASTWSQRAITSGYTVNQTPSIGSIMQTPNAAGGLGHVAYVTNVDPTTGDWTISEMNVNGLDVVDITTYPASAALKYSFIHDRTL